MAKSLREDPRDALVLREGYASLDELPVGAVIGTAASGESISRWRRGRT